MSYLSPRRPEDAFKALAEGECRILAGGTDVYPALRDRPASDNLLDISRIEEFRTIARSGADWRIGAAVTWSQVNRAALPPLFAGLQQAGREIGSLQIQNSGTLAGNLCNASPAADGVPALLVLDASVEISSLAGKRLVKLADFITGARRTTLGRGEMVSAIVIPDGPGRSAFAKLGARRYLVISIVSAAAMLDVDETGGIVKTARLAIGSCSPVALRLETLEAELAGARLDGAEWASMVERRHLHRLSPLDDVRGDRAYRLEAALQMTRRLLESLAGQIRGDRP